MAERRTDESVDLTGIDDDLHTHVARDECTIVSTRGMLISDWRSHVRTDLLPGLRRAVDEAAAIHGEGLVGLSVHRLNQRFPVPADFDANLPELTDCWRSVRKSIRATAMVVEFDGLLGAAMRGAIKLIAAAVPGTTALSVFDRRIAALQWLLPKMRSDGRTADLDHYLFVSKSLSDRDMRRAPFGPVRID